jgi:hypothetical protein
MQERSHVQARHRCGVEPERLGGCPGEPRHLPGVAVREGCLQVGEVAEGGGYLWKLVLIPLDGRLGL